MLTVALRRNVTRQSTIGLTAGDDLRTHCIRLGAVFFFISLGALFLPPSYSSARCPAAAPLYNASLHNNSSSMYLGPVTLTPK